MNIRKVRDELATIRKEVEETAVEPVVIRPTGYDEAKHGPLVVACRTRGMIIMILASDADL
jgi:hypothetical protein